MFGVRIPGRVLISVSATVLFLLTAQLATAQSSLGNWPKGTSPEEVGKRVAQHFVATPHMSSQQIAYAEVCTWYGALTFAKLSGNKELTADLIKRFDPLFTSKESALVPSSGHVDNSVFGSVPLELYMATKEQKYLDMGRGFADRQWEGATPDGLSKETRFWIDDMYMITILQVQAFRATGDAKYLDRAALEMSAYLDRLQQPHGLFFHAEDVPYFWGRGNGWVAAGMTELLRSLPVDHPRRARIIDGYRKMMAALLQFQGKDGMFRQLIDKPESWPGTSSTGMFTFAMITGVKNGWLDEKTYGKAARKGWLGMISYLEPNGDLRNVCQGTG